MVIVKEYCFSDVFEIYSSKVLNVALIFWEWSMGVKPQTMMESSNSLNRAG